MPSPFPGMDPYLEGYLWPDVHQRLASEISRRLSPYLRPKYVARLAITMLTDHSAEHEIGILYPDVEVMKTRPTPEPSSPLPDGTGGGVAVAPPIAITESLTLERPDYQVKQITIEIRDTAENRLVTSIEILSPVNKREPGLTDYRQKCDQLERAYVHLLEIDLIRRGQRHLGKHAKLADATYLVTLIRADKRTFNAWPTTLQSPLPVVAVPLLNPDPDVPLDLQAALTAIYDEAAYDLSIDYGQMPPPPDLKPEDQAWFVEQGWGATSTA